MKRFYLLFLAAFLTSHLVKSQDFIVKRNNDTVFCKILEIADDKITYQITDKNAATTKSINTRYVANYGVTENEDTSLETKFEQPQKTSAFFLTFGGGYSRQGGKNEHIGDHNVDELNDALFNGIALETSADFFPSWKEENSNCGISLNLLYNNHSGKGSNIPFYSFGGTANHFKITNIRTYVGPAFAWFSDFSKVKMGGLFGLGAIHLTQKVNSDIVDYQASTT